MREIKFRVWTGASMSYNWTVNFPATPINRIITDIQENAGELMQYTGLKDRHGKEIYEGDVVRDGFPTGADIGEIVYGTYLDMDGEYYPEQQGYHVKWHKKHYSPPDDTMCDELWGEHDSIEVIGNIYENPELTH